MADCCPGGCPDYDREFDTRVARAELASLRKQGPREDTARLIAALSAGGLEGLSVLDVGAGVGAVHLALLEGGARNAVDVDASAAYVAAAREEARRRGLADRVTHVTGDFVAVADSLEAADLVVLDRVVCCYADVSALVAAAARLTRRRLGLVYPVDRWWTRLALGIENAWAALRRRAFRAYVHPPALVDELAARHGLRPLLVQRGAIWQLVVYERPV